MGNAPSVIAAYLLTIIAFRVGVALTCGPKALAGESWLHTNFTRPVPSHTLWTLIIPIGGAVIMGTYTNPPVPWLDNFGGCLSDLGYTLGGILWLIRGHFEVLGLHKRSSILLAAIGFFVAGTIITNRGLFTS